MADWVVSTLRLFPTLQLWTSSTVDMFWTITVIPRSVTSSVSPFPFLSLLEVTMEARL